jgi:heat shock protein HtpX
MYGLILAIVALGGGSGTSLFLFGGIFAVLLTFAQYMIGPKMVERSMHVRYVTESEYPELHRMIADLALRAGIPKPRVGISKTGIPNAFAFGKSTKDARVCVTEGILRLMNKAELKAVLGHEISHIKHRDVTIITILSVVPMICYIIYITFLWGGMFGGRDERGPTIIIGLIALIIYFITSLLVMYGSRIREYYADKGSTELGNEPHQLASALYKLVYGNAKLKKESLKEVEGLKAFFLNDPSRARREIMELAEIDIDMSGTIDRAELMRLRGEKVHISTTDRMMEIWSTHPNMVKRIKHLSSL